MRLLCWSCAKSVSTEVPESTVIRALLTCPECLGKEQDLRTHAEKLALALERFGTLHQVQIPALLEFRAAFPKENP